MKPFDDELISGSILRSVWKILWPIVTLNMINGVHGFVDHVLVGRYVVSPENAANAGIGVAWQVFLVFVVFISSLYHGMNVLVARYAGRRDRETMSQVAYQTFLCSIYVLLFVAGPLGYVISPYLIEAIRPAPMVADYATSYIRILFVGGSPIFLMFMLTGAMQSSGDPRTPLVLGALTTALNVILSIILITGAGPFPALGANGAAVATCMAPVLSVIIAASLILRNKTIIAPPPRFTLMLDPVILKVVARIGIPSGLQAVLLNIGGVMLLRYIGMLENSASAQAAFTICYSQLFSFVAWPSWALRNAAGTIMGQNIGAGNLARGKQSIYVAASLGFGWAFLMGLLYWGLPGWLMGLFNATEEPVFGFGVSLLRYLAFSGMFLSSALAFTGGLVGAGDTVKPMVIALITQIGVLLGACQLFILFDVFTTNTVWTAILMSHMSRFFITYIVFHRNTWSRVAIEVGT